MCLGNLLNQQDISVWHEIRRNKLEESDCIRIWNKISSPFEITKHQKQMLSTLLSHQPGLARLCFFQHLAEASSTTKMPERRLLDHIKDRYRTLDNQFPFQTSKKSIGIYENPKSSSVCKCDHGLADSVGEAAKRSDGA